MTTLGQHSRQEILTQKQAWVSALQAVSTRSDAILQIFRRNRDRDLLFVGCGSPYYLGLSAAAFAQANLGVRARAVPSSELIFFAENVLPTGPQPLIIAASRSGETSETIAAVRAMRQRTADIIALGCDSNTTLLKQATLAIEVSGGREQSVAQTRSFSGMLLAAQATIATAANAIALLHELQQLPALADTYIPRAWALAEQVINTRAIDRFFYLGSGTRYGLACEAMLKMKEMSLSHAEAFHFLEFRHGPMSVVDKGTLVIGLVSERAAEAELAVLREMHDLGALTMAIGESEAALRNSADIVLSFESGLPSVARDLLYMPPVQALAYHHAIRKGLDCDKPRHLATYVKLPGLT